MNFLSVKFMVSIGVVIVIALGGAGLEIWRLNGALNGVRVELKEANTKLALKDAAIEVSASNLNECNLRIDLQNAKFEQLEIKKQDAIRAANRAKARFEKMAVPAKNAACGEKLKFYEELMNEANK
ncbi:hypothetical protein [uncultured Campylobacter sp.]|uniref:hypothetical protein n=1 Tax=uncultured Campylobacter sp. TaxID=218934 RepID=UPI0028E21237|nr:hypothetical protein [uncultured Campylobacter sp.]